jgi:hypothetical protein
VTVGVAGQFTDRNDQITSAAPVRPGAAGVLGDERPDHVQVVSVGQHGSIIGDRVQRLIAPRRERGGRVVGGAGLRGPAPDQHRMGQPGARGDARVRCCLVIGAQDADRDVGERQVDQGFVPDSLAPLRSGPPIP